MSSTTNKTNRKPATAAASAKLAKAAQARDGKQRDAQPGRTAPARKPRQQAQGNRKTEKSSPKQSRVLGMLQSPEGATIAAMMQTTGWQPHSVRGFLAGVVRNRLQLNLTSEKVGDNRVYRIKESAHGKPKDAHSRRRAA